MSKKPFKLDNQDYDITPELKVRKILEKETQNIPKLEFDGNSKDQYGYDLKVFFWKNLEKEPQKQPLGYVEVEHTDNYIFVNDEKPKNWPEISFLKRKVYKPVRDRDNNFEEWKNTPKNNYKDTLYLKLDSSYTSCFCASIEDIFDYGEESYRSKGEDYNGDYLGLDKKYVSFGIDKSVKRILDFFDISKRCNPINR